VNRVSRLSTTALGTAGSFPGRSSFLNLRLVKWRKAIIAEM
jgi:hypothetical protein